MSSLLNILGGDGQCGSGGSGKKGCGSHGGCGCSDPQLEASRREFLAKATTLSIGSFSLTLLPVSPDVADRLGPDADEDSLAQAVAESAGRKNQKEVVYGFLVDTERCIGAGKCLTACRVENNVPEGYARTWVERFVHFKDGRLQVDLVPETGYEGSGIPEIDPEEVERAYFVPKLCNQCEDAPCNQVCPVHASYTSPEGVELVDGDRVDRLDRAA